MPSNPELPQTADDSAESFDKIFAQYEQSQRARPEAVNKGREGTVVAVTADSVLVDIGYKSEGLLPLSAFPQAAPKVGDKLVVSIKGRDPEGYYQLSRGRIERPKDWAALEKAFENKATIVGTVTAAIKGGLSVDVGV